MKPFNTPLANRFPAASLREVGINTLEVVQAVNRTERGELDLCLGESQLWVMTIRSRISITIFDSPIVGSKSGPTIGSAQSG